MLGTYEVPVSAQKIQGGKQDASSIPEAKEEDKGEIELQEAIRWYGHEPSNWFEGVFKKS